MKECTGTTLRVDEKFMTFGLNNFKLTFVRIDLLENNTLFGIILVKN